MRKPKRGQEAWKHIYKSAHWERLRSTVLSEEPFCRFCLEEGRKIPANVVDHKIPHKGNTDLFYDFDNLTSLCFSCHNSKKQKMERGVLVMIYDKNGFPVGTRK